MKNFIFTEEQNEIIKGLKQGKYLDIEINGEKYHVNKNKWFYKYDEVYRYHKNSNKKVMENKTFKRPHISDLGFSSTNEFKDFIFKECEKETGISENILRTELSKSNSSKILEKLSLIWGQNFDCDELYNNKFYMLETLHCGLHVTSQFGNDGYMSPNSCCEKLIKTIYQMGLCHRDMDGKSFQVLDLGSGLGITTLFLSLYLPNSTIYYNEINPPTLNLFKKLIQKSGLKNIKMIDHREGEKLSNLDMVVGIEFFEHIQKKGSLGDPMLLVDVYTQKLNDEGIFIMNTFWDDSKQSIPSLGHFEDYIFDGVTVNRLDKGNKHPQKMFNECMKNRGWKKLNNVFWDWRNHGPNTFVKQDVNYSNPPKEFFMNTHK